MRSDQIGRVFGTLKLNEFDIHYLLSQPAELILIEIKI